METFSALLALCVGNSSVTDEFPSQKEVMRSFDVCFDLRLNKGFGKRSRRRWLETPSRSLRRHFNLSRSRLDVVNGQITLNEISIRKRRAYVRGDATWQCVLGENTTHIFPARFSWNTIGVSWRIISIRYIMHLHYCWWFDIFLLSSP